MGVVAHGESTDYLGRTVCFANFHVAEIKRRLTKGWAVFAKYNDELCGKHYPLRARLRLFHACVTPTVLYGSGAWTMTAEREHLLSTVFRKMLRCGHASQILGARIGGLRDLG